MRRLQPQKDPLTWIYSGVFLYLKYYMYLFFESGFGVRKIVVTTNANIQFKCLHFFLESV